MPAPGTIAHSDALPFLASLEAGSIELVIMDPPYNIKKDHVSWDSWPSDAAYLAWLREHLVALRRVLQPNGSLYCFAAPQMAAKVEVLIGEVFRVLNQIVWVKDAGWHKKTEKEALRSYHPNTERIIFAEQYASDSYAMGEAGYAAAEQGLKTSLFAAPILDAMTATHTTAKQVTEAIGAYGEVNHGGAVSNWLSGANIPTKAHYEAMRIFFNTRNGHTDHLRQEYEDLRRPFFLTPHVPYTDVMTFRPVLPEPGKHLCEKPIPLLKHLITVSSRPGSVVLDCFAGSGSTLDAARQLGRRWLGCDSDPVWAARAQARLRAPYTPSLFGEVS